MGRKFFKLEIYEFRKSNRMSYLSKNFSAGAKCALSENWLTCKMCSWTNTRTYAIKRERILGTERYLHAAGR